MAKRKRLTPARLDGSDIPEGLETKSMFPSYPDGVWTPPRRVPIADVAHDAAATAALSELSDAMASARAEGRLIVRLPLDDIDEAYLMRDRMVVDGAEMESLVESIRARGQQTAIEVADLGNGRYGLISGWRRLQALRQLSGEGKGSVLALIRAPQEQADAYLAMVEENEIRAGLSYYERARIVVRSVDGGVFDSDRAGLSALFAAASRSKRSKIGSFVRIVRALDGALRFPAALSERAGLALAQALDIDPTLEQRLISALDKANPTAVEAEAEVIAQAIETPAVVPAPALKKESIPAEPAEPRAVATQPASLELRPGLSVRETNNGLLLSGRLLADDSFKERLIAFLSQG